VKSRAGCYSEVEDAIRARHPYELPEIIAVPLSDGLAPYLQWLTDETVAR
jgi:periplasmic divalent cation tolerance protein